MERFFCFIICGLVVFAPVAENAPTQDEIVRCFQRMSEKSEQECCPETVFDYVDVQENPCETLNGTQCDEATCLFKTVGIVKDGSTIDHDEGMKLLTSLAKDKPVSKEMAERVQRFCFGEERYMIYFEDPKDNDCEPMQLAFCSYVHSLIACTDTPQWKQNQECKDYLPEVKTCARMIYEEIDAVKAAKEKKE